jgi:hypothetical protein
MNFFSIEQVHNNVVYKLSPFFGDLSYFPAAKPRAHRLPLRVCKVIAQCNDPYQLESNLESQALLKPLPSRSERQAELILQRMLLLPSISFYFAWRYSSLRVPLFPDSGSAISWFNSHTPESQRDRLCLPRSLFAAKTSITFPSLGAVIIGTMLPTNSLHAWVIEENRQPDDLDNSWICYQPIAVLM